MDPVVSAEGLTKRYGDLTALRDVSLAIGRGEIFVLIGPNGAGKTTFVRAVTGTLAPTAGEARLLGAAPATVSRSRIGLLPQSFQPPGRLTGREILRYYAGLYDHPRAVEDVLDDVGMRDDADRWFERLSGGQQRRICVGTALVNDPELLILDEPTTGIDPAGRRRVWDLLTSLRADGRTVLLTTHDMTEAATLGDRVGLLADGELVAVGSPDDLIQAHGGTGRVVVEPAGPVDAETLPALEIPLTAADGRLVVEDVGAGEVGRVIGELEAADLEYTGIAWEGPTLEDVFFALTGDGGPGA